MSPYRCCRASGLWDTIYAVHNPHSGLPSFWFQFSGSAPYLACFEFKLYELASAYSFFFTLDELCARIVAHTMVTPRDDTKPSLVDSVASPNPSISDSSSRADRKAPSNDPPLAPPLSSSGNQRMEAALGDAILRFLRIRKGKKSEEYDLDAVYAPFLYHTKTQQN